MQDYVCQERHGYLGCTYDRGRPVQPICYHPATIPAPIATPIATTVFVTAQTPPFCTTPTTEEERCQRPNMGNLERLPVAITPIFPKFGGWHLYLSSSGPGSFGDINGRVLPSDNNSRNRCPFII